MRELRKEVEEEESSDPDRRVWLKTRSGLSISLGPCSNAWAVRNNRVFVPRKRGKMKVQRDLTLRIEGAYLSDEKSAGALLERVGNASLFELDRTLELGLDLVRGGRAFGLLEERLSRRRGSSPAASLPSVNREYDREPISLYWYARRSSQIPLLRFLAYYQVLEFYFPLYSRTTALEGLRNFLSGIGRFDRLRDADIARLFETMRINRRGGVGNEREQLQRVIERCVEAEELREFFLGNEERRRFYNSALAARLASTTISLTDPVQDLRRNAARRIYEIRNRIVHTKSGYDDLDPIFPFDPETELLNYDTDLVEFLARSALRTSSRTFA